MFLPGPSFDGANRISTSQNQDVLTSIACLGADVCLQLLHSGHSQHTRKNLWFGEAGEGVAMLKSFGNHAKARTATIDIASVAKPGSTTQTSGNLGELERSNNSALIEVAVAEAERRVPELNDCVNRQRQLVKQLASAGKDVTSAQIMLDSLIVSLFLAAEERHRLRVMLNTRR